MILFNDVKENTAQITRTHVGNAYALNAEIRRVENNHRLELAARFTEARIRSTGHCEVAFADHAVRLADALVKAAQE